MNEKYKNIINLPHHVSKTREPMPISDRAAQFAPYSALSGYESAVEETARLTDKQIELDESEKERINLCLTSLCSASVGTIVSITYFRPDHRKNGGAYITVTGEFDRIDEIERKILLINSYPIEIDKIVEICKKDHQQI